MLYTNRTPDSQKPRSKRVTCTNHRHSPQAEKGEPQTKSHIESQLNNNRGPTQGKSDALKAPQPTKTRRRHKSQIPVSTLPTSVTIAARKDLGKVLSVENMRKDPWVQHGRKKETFPEGISVPLGNQTKIKKATRTSIRAERKREILFRQQFHSQVEL